MKKTFKIEMEIEVERPTELHESCKELVEIVFKDYKYCSMISTLRVINFKFISPNSPTEEATDLKSV